MGRSTTTYANNRTKKVKLKVVLVFLLQFFCCAVLANSICNISQEEAMQIGVKIWHNECAGKISGLTSWNQGEKFASLGIGHFIWSPDQHIGFSEEGFPQLLKYMASMGVTLPYWLQGENVPPCPWSSREDFQAAQNSEKMQELRQFLVSTIPLQAQFMVYRLINAVPKIADKTNYEERNYILEQFANLSSTPQGLYALVDYVNFKGDGTGWFSRRKIGWGLLQVLEGMKVAPYNYSVLESFVWSANRVLTQRVRNAPIGSNEERWLPGWRKRLMTYLDEPYRN